MTLIYSLLAGVVFGAGLTISDMVNPARVLNFLDFAGHWDPTLMFVMAGGLAVTAIGYRVIFRRGSTLTGESFRLPTQRRIDLRLVGGSALFGVGWGAPSTSTTHARACTGSRASAWSNTDAITRSGPAITDLMTLEPKVLVFVAAMLIGMIATAHWRDRVRPLKSLAHPEEA